MFHSTANDVDRLLLQRLGTGACSGPELAELLKVSRAAVWKRIERLRAMGVAIDAVPGRGYQLPAPINWLDPGQIRRNLAPSTLSLLGGLEVVWDVDSTNSKLLRRSPGVRSDVLFAERQHAGRGRHGRSWVTPLGAQLAFSIQRQFAGGVGALAGLSLAVGVAVAEGLAAAGYSQVRLKWPNDLVVGSRKLGGILIEFGGEFAGPAKAVIGVGINLALPAAASLAIDQPWIDLQQLNPNQQAPDRNTLAAHLLDALLPALEGFDAEGLAAFAPRWNALDSLRGREVDVLGNGTREVGVALGIADNGALRVRHADGERLHYSAEVSVRAGRHEKEFSK